MVFDYELAINGRTLERPVNYMLLPIKPEPGVVDPKKRPFVIVDPRSGHGPDIGGSKEASQVGAVRARSTSHRSTVRGGRSDTPTAAQPVYGLLLFGKPPLPSFFFVGDEAQGHSLSTTYHPVEPTTGHLQAVGVVRHDFPLLPRGAGHVGHLRSFRCGGRAVAGTRAANGRDPSTTVRWPLLPPTSSWNPLCSPLAAGALPTKM